MLLEHVQQFVGPKANKVVGMLIDLPIEDLKLVMQDFSLFNTRVQQASEVIDKQQSESMSIFSG